MAGNGRRTKAGWQRRQDANAYEFIMKLPDRYETETGEKGSCFSSGERQRLAIARALVKNPQFLLLDEAACNLDAYHAAKVQASIRKLMGMRTCVIVAHDMELARAADHIVVLDQGRGCGEGSHEALYDICAVYRNLVDMQRENRRILTAQDHQVD